MFAMVSCLYLQFAALKLKVLQNWQCVFW